MMKKQNENDNDDKATSHIQSTSRRQESFKCDPVRQADCFQSEPDHIPQSDRLTSSVDSDSPLSSMVDMKSIDVNPGSLERSKVSSSSSTTGFATAVPQVATTTSVNPPSVDSSSTITSVAVPSVVSSLTFLSGCVPSVTTRSIAVTLNGRKYLDEVYIYHSVIIIKQWCDAD